MWSIFVRVRCGPFDCWPPGAVRPGGGHGNTTARTFIWEDLIYPAAANTLPGGFMAGYGLGRGGRGEGGGPHPRVRFHIVQDEEYGCRRGVECTMFTVCRMYMHR
jgi:hypothetical protein